MSIMVKGSGGGGGIKVTNGIETEYRAYSGEVEAGTFVSVNTTTPIEGVYIKGDLSSLNGSENYLLHIDGNRWLHARWDNSPNYAPIKLTVVSLNEDGTLNTGNTVTAVSKSNKTGDGQSVLSDSLIHLSGDKYMLFYSYYNGTSVRSWTVGVFVISINGMAVSYNGLNFTTSKKIHSSASYNDKSVISAVKIDPNHILVYRRVNDTQEYVTFYTVNLSDSSLSLTENSEVALTTTLSSMDNQKFSATWYTINANRILLLTGQNSAWDFQINVGGNNFTATKLTDFTESASYKFTFSNLYPLDSNNFVFFGQYYWATFGNYLSIFFLTLDSSGGYTITRHSSEYTSGIVSKSSYPFITQNFLYGGVGISSIKWINGIPSLEDLFTVADFVTGVSTVKHCTEVNGYVECVGSDTSLIRIYPDKLLHNIKPATVETGIQGITSTKATTEQAGKVWLLNE